MPEPVLPTSPSPLPATVASSTLTQTVASSAIAAPAVVTPPPAPVAAPVAQDEEVLQNTKVADMQLDPAMLGFILSPRYRTSQEVIRKDFGLTEDDLLLIGDLDRMVMGGKLTLEQYLLTLEDELTKIPEANRDRLYSKLLAERFVPLGSRLTPSAVDVARSEGLTLPRTGHYRIYDKPLTFSGVATEAAATAGFSIMGGPVRERLRDLVMSKMKGVRTAAQVREVLTRSIDVGGVGLDATAAENVIAAIDDILSRATVMSEEQYATWLSDQAHPRVATTPIASPVATEPVDPEIAAIQARMSAQPSQPQTELEKAIAATLGRVGYRPPDEYLSKRLRNVISSRLRDVRSQMELKQLLMRDTKVGGLGLKPDEAEGLAKQVEAAYEEFHGIIAQEEKGKIQGQLEEQKRKVEERRKQEAEEHARWFEEKIRARKTGEAQKTQVFQDLRRVMGGQTTPIDMPHPVDAKEQRMETAKFGPLVPTPPGAIQKPIMNEQGMGPGKRSPASELAPRNTPMQATPLRVSPATIKLAEASTSSRPSLDGMSYAGPQLVGLVGELKRLTVAEFRRMAKDPQEAAAKIRQKVEILGQESFEKRVEGVRAFQESPLQGAYMSLVGESFKTMRPVAALADEKRKAGGDSLSSDEIAAIVSLNGTLHF